MCCRSLAIVLFEHWRRSQVARVPVLPYKKMRAGRCKVDAGGSLGPLG